MPRYSVTITAGAAKSLALTSSTTATFSARGFSVVMCTSFRFDSVLAVSEHARSEWRSATRSDHGSPRLVGAPILHTRSRRRSASQRSSASDLAWLWASAYRSDLGTQAVGVDLDAWSHRRRQRDLLQVATLGSGGL